MPNYQALFDWLPDSPIASMSTILPALIRGQFDATRWGELPLWLDCLERLPKITADRTELRTTVCIGSRKQLTIPAEQFRQMLMALHPWRKGPFELFGCQIDTEWRSDMKWDRLLPHIQPLRNRLVLDVGCGNGYHCWRMLGAGAQRVIGIDPSVKFVCQFQAVKRFVDDAMPIDVLPLGIQQMPAKLHAFDSAFSMGVLYHRKSPIDHLQELWNLIRPGGQLILETLIVNGPKGMVLVPEGRYAKMRNVWFLPSPETLISWLTKIGFENPRLVDSTVTSPTEQRSTDWMTYHSLNDFLHPDGSGNTAEGHPPPIRGIFIAEVPF
jgi:tRNA (mo5U34)-methyltransferase